MPTPLTPTLVQYLRDTVMGLGAYYDYQITVQVIKFDATDYDAPDVYRVKDPRPGTGPVLDPNARGNAFNGWRSMTVNQFILAYDL